MASLQDVRVEPPHVERRNDLLPDFDRSEHPKSGNVPREHHCRSIQRRLPGPSRNNDHESEDYIEPTRLEPRFLSYKLDLYSPHSFHGPVQIGGLQAHLKMAHQVAQTVITFTIYRFLGAVSPTTHTHRL